MDKKLAAFVVASLLGVLMLCWEIQTELELQGEMLKTLTEDTRGNAEKLQALIHRVPNLPDPEPTTRASIAPPSKNPTKDVTGASARLVRRTASKNQCARACGTLIQCLAGAEMCPGIGTGDSRSASLECSKRCATDPALKTLLMDKTDCPTQAVPDIPPALRDLCLISR
ncbi:MAG: hypothetical protein ACPGQS_06515 [Bradymonadia bacterium]